MTKFIKNNKINIKRNDIERSKKHEIVRNKRRNIGIIQKAKQKTKKKSVIKLIKSKGAKNEKVKVKNHHNSTENDEMKVNPKKINEMKQNPKKANEMELENIAQELFWKDEIKNQLFKEENENSDRLNEDLYEVPDEAKDNDTIMVDEGKNSRPSKEVESISTQNETKKERSQRPQHIRNRCVTLFMNNIFEVLNTICRKELNKVNILDVFGYSVEDYKYFFDFNPIIVFSVDGNNEEVFQKYMNDNNIKLFKKLSLKKIKNYL